MISIVIAFDIYYNQILALNWVCLVITAYFWDSHVYFLDQAHHFGPVRLTTSSGKWPPDFFDVAIY